MKHRKIRNAACALLGISTLTICILACTSFSPDDKKILYPSSDPKTGAMGVAVYDRPSGKSQLVFVSKTYSAELTSGKDEEDKTLLRSQWLPDGKHIVVTWTDNALEPDTNRTSFIVMSLDNREPVRVTHLAGLKEGGGLWSAPLPMVGTRLFVRADTNRIVSLDLITGELRHHLTKDNIIAVYLSPVTNRLGFAAETEDGKLACGLLNLETMARDWQLPVNNKIEDVVSLAFSPTGRKVALGPDPDRHGKPLIEVFEEGKAVRQLPVSVEENEEITLGDLAFAPNGEWLVAPFALETEGTNGQSLGFVEVPLDGSAVRRTILITNAPLTFEYSARLFSMGLSHNGKSLAAASTCVTAGEGNEDFRSEDCALFLVDLADPQRQVTKIPIPLPAHRGWLGK